MPLEIRAITGDELPEFHAVEAAGFGDQPDDASLAEHRRVFHEGRGFAAFADGQLVGTTNSYPFDLTLPGGATLPVAGVSDVTVAATHRRRGILRAMMAAQLDDVVARGEPMAVLNASEAPIYGRFGYGLAQSYQSWSINTHKTRFREPVGDDVVLRRIERDEAAKVLPAIYDAWRAQQPGAMSHSTAWWSCVLDERVSWKGGGDIFLVVAEPTADHAGGYAIYLIDSSREAGEWVVDARNVVATDPVVEARLWRYLLEIDLAGTVVSENVALENDLRWWLTDGRQVKVTKQRDYLFVRILDVATVLAARRYDHDGSVVLDVADRSRPSAPATNGRFRLTQRDGEVTCEPTADAPDVALDIAELGALLLAGVSARSLARTGWIAARTDDAVRRTDELFGWPVGPYCITRF